MLDIRNIKIKRLNKSLDHKNLGPFKITKVHNKIIYKLELPTFMEGLYPVFHPWLLYLVDEDSLPG